MNGEDALDWIAPSTVQRKLLVLPPTHASIELGQSLKARIARKTLVMMER